MFCLLMPLHAFRGQFKSNELFIFGESYGGHYAPNVAHRIGSSLNLKVLLLFLCVVVWMCGWIVVSM